MGYLSLVLFWLACVAEEVVELEPVGASNQNTFNCNQYADQGACEAQDGGKTYCIWNSTNNYNKCIDDPQLRVLAEGDTTSCSQQPDGVPGTIFTVPGALTSDCVEAKGSGKICAFNLKNANSFNYCIYAWLRDGVCPDSVCVKETSSTFAGAGRDQCLPSTTTQCGKLGTKTECGLVPKCYWSSDKCYDDPCWATGPLVSPYTCGGLQVILPTDSTPTNKTNECVLFQPLLATTVDFCVHKSQSNPNICYFGTPGATLTPGNDYGNTYPKTSPTCTGTIPTGCDGNGNCTSVINTKGALAGQYCSDGTHGSANILHVPFMLVLLILTALSMFVL